MAGEVKTPEEFLAKWNAVTLEHQFGEYWTKTPARLYWCLAYDLSETRLRECAKDLLYVSIAGEWNTSVLHARTLLNSYIGSN
jgi:hypothetical protein